MITYHVRIVDDKSDLIYVTTFEADDAQHAKEQADDHVRTTGEHVGLILPGEENDR